MDGVLAWVWKILFGAGGLVGLAAIWKAFQWRQQAKKVKEVLKLNREQTKQLTRLEEDFGTIKLKLDRAQNAYRLLQQGQSKLNKTISAQTTLIESLRKELEESRRESREAHSKITLLLRQKTSLDGDAKQITVASGSLVSSMDMLIKAPPEEFDFRISAFDAEADGYQSMLSSLEETCPKCGSNNTSGYGDPVLNHICLECGHVWPNAKKA